MPEDEEEVRVEMLTSIAGTKDFGPKPWRGFCFNIGTVQSVPRWKAGAVDQQRNRKGGGSICERNASGAFSPRRAGSRQRDRATREHQP